MCVWLIWEWLGWDENGWKNLKFLKLFKKFKIFIKFRISKQILLNFLSKLKNFQFLIIFVLKTPKVHQKLHSKSPPSISLALKLICDKNNNKKNYKEIFFLFVQCVAQCKYSKYVGRKSFSMLQTTKFICNDT